MTYRHHTAVVRFPGNGIFSRFLLAALGCFSREEAELNTKKPCSEHTVCKYTFQIFYPPSAGLPQGKVSSVCDPGQSGNWGYASEPARASVHTPKSRPFILAPHLLVQREEKHPSSANKNREKNAVPRKPNYCRSHQFVVFYLFF